MELNRQLLILAITIVILWIYIRATQNNIRKKSIKAALKFM